VELIGGLVRRVQVAGHHVGAVRRQQRSPVAGARSAVDQRRVRRDRGDRIRAEDRPGEGRGEFAAAGRHVERLCQATSHRPVRAGLFEAAQNLHHAQVCPSRLADREPAG
jgi:hypothetical protein